MTGETILFERHLQPHRQIILEYEIGEPSAFSYLIGNTKPVHIDINSCAISPVHCLFLGSGDLRNTLHLVQISSVPQWEFHLVDINPCIVARNLLFLELLNDETLSVNILWCIWYDFLLEERLSSDLKMRIENLSNSDLDSVRQEDRPMIKKIFLAWLNLYNPNVNEENACQQRHDHLSSCFKRSCHATFDDYVKTTCKSVKATLCNEDKATIERAQDEIRCYINNGTTGPEEDRHEINVTMLQATSGAYTGHYDMHPYQSYLPFENVEEERDFREKASQTTYPLFTYCQQQLKEWIVAYRQNRRRIQWHFYCGDALNIALFSMYKIEFDLIHTSNLCDHVDMLNLLVTCVPLLRHRSWSQILTQSMKWRFNHARFLDYMTQIFNGVELSWLPSILGLICQCTRTIGLHSSNIYPEVTLRNMMNSFEYQVWRLSTNVEMQPHLRLEGADENILNVLDKIAERCFYLHLTEMAADQGTGHSTTLTYYLFLRQYSRRNCTQPEETFEYLFQRTCHRYRAYATGLRGLHALFSSDETLICTPKRVKYSPVFNLTPDRIYTPALQLLLFDGSESLSETVLRALYSSQFRKITAVKAENDEIQYDLCTGKMTLTRDLHNPIQFHLLDNFVFELAVHSARGIDNPLTTYLQLANNASIQFALPLSFTLTTPRAVLIDIHTWFPFAYFEFEKIPTPVSIPALAMRDAVCSCFADVSDRNRHCANNVYVRKAIETTLTYQILLQMNVSMSSACTLSKKLISEGHILILMIKFSSKNIITLQFAFACPLNLTESKFEFDRDNHTFNLSLVKDVNELISFTTFTHDPCSNLFRSVAAKRWPPPRLANGDYLEPRLDLPPPLSIGAYDVKTAQLCDALTSMFTFAELRLTQRQSGEHYFQDAEFDLRESIKHMFLQAFCTRLRLAWYSTKRNTVPSPADIRTYGDILFLYEGIFDHENRPILAVTYIDMKDIDDKKVIDMTRQLRAIISVETYLQVQIIRQARKIPTSYPTDNNVFDIVASKEELGLMRKLLAINSKRTEGSHRQGLIGPWHASFVEPLRVDHRSILGQTKLTQESGIKSMNEMENLFGCQVCKKFPTSPERLWPKCSRCKRVYYCSPVCQQKDWIIHKKSCQANSFQ